jgi:hypothetical protein
MKNIENGLIILKKLDTNPCHARDGVENVIVIFIPLKEK